MDAFEIAMQDRVEEYLGDLEIRTDGGPQFVAYEFSRTLARRGVRHTVTPARSPQHNPFAEAWIEHYRHRREQNALGGLAALEYRRELLRKIAA